MSISKAGFWYWLGWSTVRNYLLLFHRLKVVGFENVPLDGGGIISCNHISHLDPPAVGSSVPRRLRFVAKEELFHTFFIGWYLTIIGIIPVRRGSGGHMALDKAVDAVNRGEIVVMFPEGTRSKTGYPLRPHTGVVVLAARTGARVIPARISGSFDCMPPGSFIPKPGLVQVSFGKPIQYAEGELDLNDRQLLQQKASDMQDIMMALPGWYPKGSKPPAKSTENGGRGSYGNK